MSEFLEEVGREVKSLLTVVLYIVTFSLVVACIARYGGTFRQWLNVSALQGSKILHSEYLPHVIAVICTVVASLLLNWLLLWRQRRELRALIGIIYETFYGAIRPEDRTIYRVSCYRYHHSPVSRFWRRIRFTRKMLTRRPLRGSPFLKCIVRHGHEGRKPVRMPTTLTMAVSPDKAWSEGFAGLVAREQRTLTSRKKDVNSAVAKVKAKDKGVDLSGLREQLWKQVQEGEGEYRREGEVAWRAVESSCDLSGLENDEEKKLLEEFVKDTNTTPYLLLGVRGGKTHCNNFFGFPVFRKDQLWGVVTIDALDERFEEKMAKRLEPFCKKTDENPNPAVATEVVDYWIHEQLRLFATVFDDFLQNIG